MKDGRAVISNPDATQTARDTDYGLLNDEHRAQILKILGAEALRIRRDVSASTTRVGTSHDCSIYASDWRGCNGGSSSTRSPGMQW